MDFAEAVECCPLGQQAATIDQLLMRAASKSGITFPALNGHLSAFNPDVRTRTTPYALGLVMQGAERWHQREAALCMGGWSGAPIDSFRTTRLAIDGMVEPGNCLLIDRVAYSVEKTYPILDGPETARSDVANLTLMQGLKEIGLLKPDGGSVVLLGRYAHAFRHRGEFKSVVEVGHPSSRNGDVLPRVLTIHGGVHAVATTGNEPTAYALAVCSFLRGQCEALVKLEVNPWRGFAWPLQDIVSLRDFIAQ